MRTCLTIAILAVICCLCSPASPAQPTRPLTFKLDTLTKNVCGGTSFQIPVWAGDLYFADSVYGFSITVTWNRDYFDLDGSDIAISSNTIVQRNGRTVIQVQKNPDPKIGELFVTVADTSLDRSIAGTGKPLFYLIGTVTAPDTVPGIDGWITVSSAIFESGTVFDPITSEYGFIRVVRDTTPAYTGRISVTEGAFDTLRIDTVMVEVGNVKDRRVEEISFSLKAMPGYYSFIDTLQAGTLSDDLTWTVKDVTITPDSITGRFVSESAIASDGPFMKIRLRRESDSAFDQPLGVTGFEVNRTSCLGKVTKENGRVRAAAIVKEPPLSVGEESAEGKRSIRVLPNTSDGSMVIVANDIEIEDVRLFNRMGEVIGIRSSERVGPSTLRIRTAEPIASGVYFLVLRSRQETVYKQFSIIK